MDQFLSQLSNISHSNSISQRLNRPNIHEIDNLHNEYDQNSINYSINIDCKSQSQSHIFTNKSSLLKTISSHDSQLKSSHEMEIEPITITSSSYNTNQAFNNFRPCINANSPHFAKSMSALIHPNNYTELDYSQKEDSNTKCNSINKTMNLIKYINILTHIIKSYIIRKWKKNDKIFAGQYSTGATPKLQKKKHPSLLCKSQSLSNFYIDG